MINNRPNDRNGPAKATQPSAGEATTARGRVEIEMPRLVPPTPSGPPNSRTIAPPTGIGRRPRGSGNGVFGGGGGGEPRETGFWGRGGPDPGRPRRRSARGSRAPEPRRPCAPPPRLSGQ